MTYEKFVKIIKDLYIKSEKLQYHTRYYWENGWDETKYTLSWCVGGMDGGNCWNNNSYAREVEEEPEIDIDELLNRVCPHITYFQYKKIMDSVVKKETKEKREYYGNYSIRKYKTIEYRNLYDSLVNYKVI